MRRIIVLLATVALIAALAANIAQAQVTERAILDAHNPYNENNRDFVYMPTGDVRMVQTFVAEHSGYLTHARVALLAHGASREVPLQLISIPEAGAPTQVLAETTATALDSRIDRKLLPGPVKFVEPAYVEAGQTYGLATRKPATTGGSWIIAGYENCAYENGELRLLMNNDSWDVYGRCTDGGFYTYVVPSPPPGPVAKEECKNAGFEVFGYKNQGQCIKAVNEADK